MYGENFFSMILMFIHLSFNLPVVRTLFNILWNIYISGGYQETFVEMPTHFSTKVKNFLGEGGPYPISTKFEFYTSKHKRDANKLSGEKNIRARKTLR